MRKEKHITRCLTLKLDPILFATKTIFCDFLNIIFVSEDFELERLKISRSPAGRPAKQTNKQKKRKKERWARTIIPLEAGTIVTSQIV